MRPVGFAWWLAGAYFAVSDPAILKPGRPISDSSTMPSHEVTCPLCNADVPLSGDEKIGEEIFCTQCGAPLKMKGSAEEEGAEAEEDF